MKHLIYNIYPPEAEFMTSDEGMNDAWNVRGVRGDQYLSSALVVPPPDSPTSRRFTNEAYYCLLNCDLHYGNKPFPVNELPEKCPGFTQRQADRYLLPTSYNIQLQMLRGRIFRADDIRRSLFCGVVCYPVEGKLDAFDAITTSLYLNGKLSISNLQDEDIKK
jgi:hypothetical protein